MTIEEARRAIDERIVKRLEANPEGAKEVGTTVALEVTGEVTGRWVVDCTKSPVSVTESDDAAKATIMLDATALEGILSGEISPQAAFMSGSIKVDGDLGAALRLGQFLM